ncbi:MAG: acyl-CoA synthetase [Planctomycetota bacterium]
MSIADVQSLNTAAEVKAASLVGMPADLPASSYAVIERTARTHPERMAFSFFLEVPSHQKTETWSYSRLFNGVTRCANLLHGLGVRPGEVTALLLPNLPETHLGLWGGEAAGIVMPVNPLFEPKAIASLLSAAKAKVLITLAPFPGVDLYEKAAQAAREVPSLRHVVLVSLVDHVPGWRKPLANLAAWKASRGAIPMPAGVQTHRWSTLFDAARGDALISGRRIKSEEESSYFCTGGTTGLPKIAVRTHGNEVANAWMATRMLGEALAGDGTIFCGLPLFHVNAVIATGLAPFMVGGRVVLGTPQGFRAPGIIPRFWEIVAHHRISAFSGVPTLFAALLDQPSSNHDLSEFRYAFSGAAPMSVELMRKFEEKTGVTIVEGYGLTEATCISSINPVDGERRAGSVGFSLPTQEVAIVHLNAEGKFVRDAATDEVGLVVISGANVFKGYLAPEHNRGLWIDRGDGRRWLNTGDLGRLDADGYLWLAGRAKDLIIRGGHNIDPAIIEDALHAHPDVVLAAAVGRPDRYAGEVPVAYVQVRPGSSADEESLLATVKERVAERAAIPKAIRVVDAMPLTPIGKIFKPPLRLQEMTRAAADALEETGIVSAKVEARSDSKHGSVVIVTLPAEDEPRAHESLDNFAFHVQFERP